LTVDHLVFGVESLLEFVADRATLESHQLYIGAVAMQLFEAHDDGWGEPSFLDESFQDLSTRPPSAAQTSFDVQQIAIFRHSALR
jgi:hypothetical protein